MARPRTGHDEHLAFVADLERQRLLIIAPNRLRGRGASPDERRQLDVLDAAIQDLKALRAGPNGYLRLSAMTLNRADDPLFGWLDAGKARRLTNPIVTLRGRAPKTP